MILADKIIFLRKKAGFSQEELAEKLNVSRQSVSKWEGAQSVPDLQRILDMAELFGVTTDYLLKDEIEEAVYTDGSKETPNLKKLSMEEANSFLEIKRRCGRIIGTGTVLCMLSPIGIILGSGLFGAGITGKWIYILSFLWLFSFVIFGVNAFIYAGFLVKEYSYLDDGNFEPEYGVSGMVREKKKAFRKKYSQSNLAATSICITAALPVIITPFLTENALCILVAVCSTIIIAAIGVFLFINVGVVWAGFDRILQEGDYSRVKLEAEEKEDIAMSIYWPIVIGAYLGYSFVTGDWGRSWIIWPVAAVLSPAISAVFKCIGKK